MFENYTVIICCGKMMTVLNIYLSQLYFFRGVSSPECDFDIYVTQDHLKRIIIDMCNN